MQLQGQLVERNGSLCSGTTGKRGSKGCPCCCASKLCCNTCHKPVSCTNVWGQHSSEMFCQSLPAAVQCGSCSASTCMLEQCHLSTMLALGRKRTTFMRARLGGTCSVEVPQFSGGAIMKHPIPSHKPVRQASKLPLLYVLCKASTAMRT